jgi:uncharacterized phage protein (TIGR01671 family)
MRALEFRAWENGKMYYQVRCGGLFDGMPTAPTVLDNTAEWVNLTGQPYTKVMQFTGLRDANGQKIFEGDIVMGSVLNAITRERRVLLGEIVFHAEAAAFGVLPVSTGGKDTGASFPLLQLSAVVVGNIYENPELTE